MAKTDIQRTIGAPLEELPGVFELETLLGRKVDLVTPNVLSPYLKDRILA